MAEKISMRKGRLVNTRKRTSEDRPGRPRPKPRRIALITAHKPGTIRSGTINQEPAKPGPAKGGPLPHPASTGPAKARAKPQRRTDQPCREAPPCPVSPPGSRTCRTSGPLARKARAWRPLSGAARSGPSHPSFRSMPARLERSLPAILVRFTPLERGTVVFFSAPHCARCDVG